MGKFFYLPPNAKTVKWTKNSNAKSTNLTLESTWQISMALLLAKCKNKSKKPLTDHLNPQTLAQVIFSHRLVIFSDFLSKKSRFFSKKLPKNRSIFSAIFKEKIVS
jgi:hypothetical protein